MRLGVGCAVLCTSVPSSMHMHLNVACATLAISRMMKHPLSVINAGLTTKESIQKHTRKENT